MKKLKITAQKSTLKKVATSILNTISFFVSQLKL